MNKLKTYFANLWAALCGRDGVKYSLPPGVYRVEAPIILQGGGGPGEPQK